MQEIILLILGGTLAYILLMQLSFMGVKKRTVRYLEEQRKKEKK